jgi:hypothetical protein
MLVERHVVVPLRWLVFTFVLKKKKKKRAVTLKFSMILRRVQIEVTLDLISTAFPI